MTQPDPARTVLKKHEVRFHPGPPAAACPGGGPPAPAARARIVEQTATHALVEVLCPCGRVIQLRCEHAPAPAPADAARQQKAT